MKQMKQMKQSQNQASSKPIKSFRINSYNKKKLESWREETKVSAGELINALLESYFKSSEGSLSLEEADEAMEKW